ncbi:hypothetical protein ACHAXS_006965 [Conticribra weissflogii]
MSVVPKEFIKYHKVPTPKINEQKSKTTHERTNSSTCSASRILVEGPTTTFPTEFESLPSVFLRRITSSFISFAASPHLSTSRLAMTTTAPRRANSVAMERPMPVPPPVTRAIFPAKRLGRKTLCHCWTWFELVVVADMAGDRGIFYFFGRER